MSERRITVVLVDDHPIFLDGVRGLLEAADDVEVVGTGTTGADAVHLAIEHTPDVLVIDLDLPDFPGTQAIHELTSQGVATNVLVLSAFADPQQTADAFEAGVLAFVPKTQAGDLLLDAVRRAADGEGDIPQSFIGPMLTTIRERQERQRRAALLKTGLTNREREVLRRLAEGVSVEEIAVQSQLSVHTVRGHVRNILSKLGVHSMGQAIVIAYRSGEMDRTES